jgi:hypothetical protein
MHLRRNSAGAVLETVDSHPKLTSIRCVYLASRFIKPFDFTAFLKSYLPF